ncbi:unnamed protein product [Durusdinium trenchii]|uniref:Uncharacterized protein n=1 Tax=Durusdinium trenchii TaxID=1381693 RepID=A0ABP0LKD3_9DINO
MNQRVYSRLLRRVEIWGSLCFGMFRACLGRTPSQLQAKSLWTHCEKDSVKTCVQMPAVHFFRVPHNKVVAVVDPSRAGLHPRLVEILRGRLQVSRIVYISCNADSMAEDIAKLGSSTEDEADDFIPTRAVAVDSFPQTVHVEVIALVERASRVPERISKRPETEPELEAS